MREILFRGQHRRYGEQVNMAGEKLPPVWVYGGVLQGEGDFSIIYGSKSPDGKFEEKYPVYTETLGQYTGLTEKNGKKIFEGDIVCAGSEGIIAKCEVKRRIDGIYYMNPNRKTVWYMMPDNTGKTTVEILGNIHDNPELLKQAT